MLLYPNKNVTSVEDSLVVWKREGAAHGLPLAWLYMTVSLSSDYSVTGFKYINFKGTVSINTLL